MDELMRRVNGREGYLLTDDLGITNDVAFVCKDGTTLTLHNGVILETHKPILVTTPELPDQSTDHGHD